MGKQEQVQKQGSAPATQDQTMHADPADAEQADLTHTDELLDEIDDLLNTLGVETVINYVQKGGE